MGQALQIYKAITAPECRFSDLTGKDRVASLHVTITLARTYFLLIFMEKNVAFLHVSSIILLLFLFSLGLWFSRQ